MKKTIIHKYKPVNATVCGRGGDNRSTRNEKVTCGRCKLLAKFAAKRAKKARK